MVAACGRFVGPVDLEKIVIDRRSALMQLAGFGALAGFAGVSSAGAQVRGGRAELVMFDDPGCSYCRAWHREVGPAYRNSPEGRVAPLRVVQLRGPKPEGVTLASPVRATPTFVLVQDGREVGRLTGYGGADFFWGMLGDVMKKLKPGERAA
jgi:Thioredoxin-like domain